MSETDLQHKTFKDLVMIIHDLKEENARMREALNKIKFGCDNPCTLAEKTLKGEK